jgi:3-oxoacyl-[acyl-carrier protein] reductase
MDLDLADRVYVVSGGSRGLGYATAEALVREGARVVIVARDAQADDAAVSRLGPAAIGVPADLSDPAAAQRAVDAAMNTFGRIDGALISVGGPPPGSVLSTTDEQWQAGFDSVFLGSVRLARAVCAATLACGTASTAAIAWVLSTSAVEVFSGLSVSNGLRPGLAMLVTDLADEVGPRGTRVVGLLPGRIATDRITTLDAATGDAAASRARSEERIPLGRYGEPAEFGRVAAFVLSPAASYVTGTLITVDGGSTRHS